MKKYVSVILSLLMIFSVVQSFSAVIKKSPGIYNNTIFKYEIKEDGKIKIIQYLQKTEECHIPETIDNIVVNELDDTIFSDSVKTLYIPNSITKIDSLAFYFARELETIYTDCETIGVAYNKAPALKNLILQDNVKTIKDSTFENNKTLENVVVGKNVITVGYDAFFNCTSLKNVEFLGKNTQIQSEVFSECRNLQAVKLPSNLGTLQHGTFDGCIKLSSIKLPPSLTTIFSWNFYNCKSLKEINLPENLKKIDYGVFDECIGLRKIVYDAINLTDYDVDLLYDCENVTTVEIGDKVQTIPTRFFNGMKNLETVTGGENVISTGSNCFSNTKWEKSKEDGPIYIGKTLYKLKGNNSDSITVKDGTVSIGNWALANKKLTEINLPNTLQYIGDYGLYNCYSLENIKLPDSILKINKFAFSNCGLLRNITFGKNLDTIGNNAFQNCYLLNISGDYSELRHIESSAFYNCQSLSSFNMGKNLTTLGNYAFYNCKKLANVTLDNKVTTVGRYAFAECKRNEKVTLGDNVTKIGENAFSNNTALTEVVGGNNVVEIGNKAFYNNMGLTSFKIGDKVTTVGDSAFNNCTSLANVTIPKSLKAISPKMFYNCTSLKDITIPYGVTTIGYGAFYNVKQQYYYMPQTVTEIENNAFYPTDSVVLIGYKDSTAETYANNHNIKFVDNKSLPPVAERKKTLEMNSGYDVTISLNYGKPLSWFSTNSKVATVKNGKVTALQKGTTNIIAKYDYNIEIVYKLTVNSSPRLSKSTVSVKKGKTATIKIYGKADKLSNQYVNSKYAKIVANKNSSTLKIKGLKKGKSTLKVKVNGVKVLPLTVVVK